MSCSYPKKFILFLLLGISILFFVSCIYLSSPYRTLRPYAFFGKRLAESMPHRTVNGRIAILIPDSDNPFYIDQNLITIKDYKACEAAGDCYRAHYRDNYTKFYDQKIYGIFPVSFVTWEEARVFCTSQGGDLPTAAQWELAAGGLTNARYAWGNSMPGISLANLDGYYQWLTPAGWLPKGAGIYGILDLNGNLREWVLDEDAVYETAKGLKGGSFQDSFTSADNDSMIFHDQFSPGFNRGFRCVYMP